MPNSLARAAIQRHYLHYRWEEEQQSLASPKVAVSWSDIVSKSSSRSKPKLSPVEVGENEKPRTTESIDLLPLTLLLPPDDYIPSWEAPRRGSNWSPPGGRKILPLLNPEASEFTPLQLDSTMARITSPDFRAQAKAQAQAQARLWERLVVDMNEAPALRIEPVEQPADTNDDEYLSTPTCPWVTLSARPTRPSLQDRDDADDGELKEEYITALGLGPPPAVPVMGIALADAETGTHVCC